MTVDDDNSIYVGGIPYDSTEESLRRVFDLYGAIVAVKIINDRGFGGKCYGFVTFRNPRSAIDAINDMNGRKIDGRVVKVNEVKSRGGRINTKRDTVRHNGDRVSDWDRSRNRERNYDYEKERYQDRGSDPSREHDPSQGSVPPRERDRSRDRGQGRERGHELMHDQDHRRGRFLDRDQNRHSEDFLKEHNGDRDQNTEREQDHRRDRFLDRDQNRHHEDFLNEHNRDHDRNSKRDQDHRRDRFSDRDQNRHREGFLKEHNRDRDQNSERDHDIDWDGDVERGRLDAHTKMSDERKDKSPKKENGSSFSGHDGRGYSSASSGGYADQVKEKLDSSIQRREELQSEISHLEKKVEDQQERVLELQKKSLKLEDALTTARKLNQRRQMQLIKLHKFVMQVKDFSDKVKNSEQELQDLIETLKVEVDVNSDIGSRDGILVNDSA